MKLYLVQHAEAKNKETDPSRPLTEEGFKAIKKMASYAEKYLHIHIDQIIHSGKLRAKQTADVLSEYLHPTKGVVVSKDLEPLTDPKLWKKRLETATTDIMLVGHLPHLSKLTSKLFYEGESREVVTFKMGGILCLKKDEDNQWTIQWMVTPEIIP
ncbi:MAG: phosphohistidine phosphatase SixA [Candidatus Heimdallarchaeota archaeon]